MKVILSDTDLWRSHPAARSPCSPGSSGAAWICQPERTPWCAVCCWTPALHQSFHWQHHWASPRSPPSQTRYTAYQKSLWFTGTSLFLVNISIFIYSESRCIISRIMWMQTVVIAKRKSPWHNTKGSWITLKWFILR